MRIIDTDHFDCTEGERASFEAGIKLGALYHQFIGTPVSPESRKDLEKAMTSAVLSQPHVVKADVRIDSSALLENLNDLEYCSLNGKMIKAEILVRVGKAVCDARLEWIDEMSYPLMWIRSIRLENDDDC
jgi:hypothetical protein